MIDIKSLLEQADKALEKARKAIESLRKALPERKEFVDQIAELRERYDDSHKSVDDAKKEALGIVASLNEIQFNLDEYGRSSSSVSIEPIVTKLDSHHKEMKVAHVNFGGGISFYGPEWEKVGSVGHRGIVENRELFKVVMDTGLKTFENNTVPDFIESVAHRSKEQAEELDAIRKRLLVIFYKIEKNSSEVSLPLGSI